MAAAGSILGNAVQRLEDPTLLTGDGKYLDDLAPGNAPRRLRPLEPGICHLWSVDVSERSRCRA